MLVARNPERNGAHKLSCLLPESRIPDPVDILRTVRSLRRAARHKLFESWLLGVSTAIISSAMLKSFSLLPSSKWTALNTSQVWLNALAWCNIRNVTGTERLDDCYTLEDRNDLNLMEIRSGVSYRKVSNSCLTVSHGRKLRVENSQVISRDVIIMVEL